MWEKFTPSAKRIVKYAHEEAKHFRSDAVDTEHILLGLIRDKNSGAMKALQAMEADIERIQNATIKSIELEQYEVDALNFSREAKEVLEAAFREARRLKKNSIGSEHLLLGLLKVESGKAYRILNDHDITYQKAAKYIGQSARIGTKGRSKTPTLDEFGTDLTKLAKEGKLDPCIGREIEIRRIVQILSKRTKNNPVLIGDPGVGKTAIVEGLSQRVSQRKVPGILREARVVSLDLAGLVAGTKFRGEFEDRLKRVMKEIIGTEDPIILFIDELHTVIGAGAAEGAIDASNILKPALSRGELRCIGATTANEYKKYIERNGALERRFQPVNIEEPTLDETIDILHGLRDRYEDYHNVTITDEAIKAAAYFSQRFISNRHLPDKAIDLVDEAASKVRLFHFEEEELKKAVGISSSLPAGAEAKALPAEAEAPAFSGQPDIDADLDSDVSGMSFTLAGREDDELDHVSHRPEQVSRPRVVEEDIAEVVHAWTGIPVSAIAEEETEKLLRTEEYLSKRVIGQEEAIRVLARALRRARVGLKDPKRPTGAFLFAGPTGVGKTELAKTLAEFLFGDEKALIRFDMSEYMEKHSVSRLVGAPPGYVGFDEGGQLTEAVKRRPYSVILMDEIEKAHYEVFNILLQVMEDGIITDSHGRRVDMRNTILILTSNLGTSSIGVEEPMGFRSKSDEMLTPTQIYKQMEPKVNEAIKKAFRPEFLNRVDETLIFRALTRQDIVLIAKKFLSRVAESAMQHEIELKFADGLFVYLSDKGYSKTQGARPLRRLIQSKIEDQLSEHILKKDFEAGDTVIIDFRDDEVVFEKE
jgi:ATP-dependent Clp protease ATP-binding subunit ClpC